MSTSVDQRIVEMRFDNKEFERNVSTTMSSLDKLKEKLNLNGAAKGLEEVNNAAKKVDMSSLGDNIEKVGLKFSVLYSVADQAFRNITTAAMNAGTRIAKALTVDPISTGFKEYETQINAIQTILANTKSKGTELPDVNRALDELNTYADKTIYNFTEMTRNIGTFTAAGVDLDTSVSAIKGIANLAAVSGSTSQQASTAMYQLSQALSSGTVKLMDWNSVVNAGMGGQVFQDALKETARVHNVKIDEMIKKEGSFRNTLQNGWLTSEILTETLSKFTGDLNEQQLKSMGYTDEQIKGIIELGQTANDAATKVKTFTQLFDTLKEAAQSGWTQTWEIIVGDFEEAKALLTTVSDVIGGMLGESADARNELLLNWKTLGGRQAVIDALANSFRGVMAVIKAVSEAGREIFPPVTAELLTTISTKLRDVAKAFDEFFVAERDDDGNILKTTKNFENLKRTFAGIFAVINLVRHIFVTLAKAIGSVFGVTGDLAGGILSITAAVGDWLVMISNAIVHSGKFESIFTGIASVIKAVVSIFGRLSEKLGDSFAFRVISEALTAVIGLIISAGDETDRLAQAGANIKEAWERSGLYKFVMRIWTVLKDVGTKVVNSFKGVFSGITDAFSEGDFDRIFNIINGVLTGGFIAGVSKLLHNWFGSTSQIIQNVNEILDNVGDSFRAFSNKLNAEALKSIATAILMLVGSLVVLAFIDKDKLYDALASITVLVGLLALILAVIGGKGPMQGGFGASLSRGEGLKFTSFGSEFDSLALAFIGLSVALITIAGVISILGKSMNEAELKQGTTALLVLLAGLTVAMAAMGKFIPETTGIRKASAALRKIGTALLIAIVPVMLLSLLEWEAMWRGVAGVSVTLAALTLAALALEGIGKIGSNGMLKGAVACILIAYSLMEVGIALGILMGVLVGEGKLLEGTSAEGSSKLGAALIAMTVILGELLVVAALLGVFGAIPGNGMLKGAATIAIISATVTAMALAFTFVPIVGLLKSIIGLTVVVAEAIILALAFSALGAIPGNGMVKGAAAIAIIASSLMLLLPTLALFAILGNEATLRAVLGLAGVLVVLGTALAALSHLGGNPIQLQASASAIATLVASIMLLAPAMVLLGTMDIKSLGVALLAIAGAIAIFAGAALLLAPATGAIMALGLAMLSFGKGLALIGTFLLLAGIALPMIGKGLMVLAAGITTLVAAVAGSVEMIVSAAVAIVIGILQAVPKILDALVKIFPLLADALIELVRMLCDVIIECVPLIAETLLVLVLRILERFVEFVPPIVAAIVELVAEVIRALASEIPNLIDAALELVFSILEGIIAAIAGMDGSRLLAAFENVKLIALMIAELAALQLLAPFALTAVIEIGLVIGALATVLAAIGGLYEAMPGIGDLVDSAGKLLEKLGTAIGKFIGGIIGGVASSATSVLPQIGEDLSGFATGASAFLDKMPQLKDLGDTLSGLSKLKKFKAGSMEAIKEELPKLGEGVAGFADKIKESDFTNVEDAADCVSTLVQIANAIPNSGGWIAKIVGENSLADFSDDLGKLGTGLRIFAANTKDVPFTNTKAALDAATGIVELSKILPETGGWISIFTGEADMERFADDMGALGEGLKAFAEDTGELPDLTNAVNACNALATLTASIPNEDGLAAWFTGARSVSRFSEDLGNLGSGLANFATNFDDTDPKKLEAAASAGEALVKMTKAIPNEGGLKTLFTGSSSFAKYSKELGDLGSALATFAENANQNGVLGTVDELGNITGDKITPAINAASALIEMTNTIPKVGGMADWFTGTTTLDSFPKALGKLGEGVANFAGKTDGLTEDKVKPAADAAVALIEMTSKMPKEDGVLEWFTGSVDLEGYALSLGLLGLGLANFARNAAGTTAEKVSGAVEAGKAIAELTKSAPVEGGIKAWFMGETDITAYADKLPALGSAIAGFATNLNGISDFTGAEGAAKAGVALAEMTKSIPQEGGIKAWFSGSTGFATFADNVPLVATAIRNFAANLGTQDLSSVESAANAAKTLAEMTDHIPMNPTKLVMFGNNLGTFGDGLKAFINKVKDISESSISKANKVIDIAESAASIDAGKIKNVADRLDDLADAVKDMEKDIKSDMADAGKKAVEGYIKGIDDKIEDAEDKAEEMVEDAADAASDEASEFKSAGKDLVEGFVDGIDKNTWRAEAKAKAMATAALNAAKEALDSHSPSRKFMALGEFGGLGFVNGLDAYLKKSHNAGYEMGDSARSGLSDAIAKIQDFIERDVDTEPTIRPVLDLSDVESRAGLIGGLFGAQSIGVRANIGAINSMMNARNQNGTNDDVIAAINELRDEIGNVGGTTYNIEGITYDDGSNIAEAVGALIRAAKIERRA